MDSSDAMSDGERLAEWREMAEASERDIQEHSATLARLNPNDGFLVGSLTTSLELARKNKFALECAIAGLEAKGLLAELDRRLTKHHVIVRWRGEWSIGKCHKSMMLTEPFEGETLLDAVRALVSDETTDPETHTKKGERKPILDDEVGMETPGGLILVGQRGDKTEYVRMVTPPGVKGAVNGGEEVARWDTGGWEFSREAMGQILRAAMYGELPEDPKDEPQTWQKAYLAGDLSEEEMEFEKAVSGIVAGIMNDKCVQALIRRVASFEEDDEPYPSERCDRETKTLYDLLRRGHGYGVKHVTEALKRARAKMGCEATPLGG
jgi:hypothetical protein